MKIQEHGWKTLVKTHQSVLCSLYIGILAIFLKTDKKVQNRIDTAPVGDCQGHLLKNCFNQLYTYVVTTKYQPVAQGSEGTQRYSFSTYCTHHLGSSGPWVL